MIKVSSLKDSIKHCLGYIRCRKNGIKPNHNVYIGKSVNIVGGVISN